MCGICGFIPLSRVDKAHSETALSRMTDTIVHRGPDSEGTWLCPKTGMGLGHRRLAILDLSPAGHQPMASADGRYVLAYNGEVYNHLDLRTELEANGHSFRGSSDTETLLAAFLQWGFRKTIARCVGMFAMAIWDTHERRLHLVRDRLGIKPLYYGKSGSTFLFGSELKSLRSHPDFTNPIDRDALALFFRHAYIPAPHSIYSGIRKLTPGTILSIDMTGSTNTETYWSAVETWRNGQAAPFTGTVNEAADRLEAILQDAVKVRMLSDVPIGAFLSGGIDSSTVVALMQQASATPVRTFSIGFHENAFNEAPSAARIARHLGTDHTEMYVTPQDMLDVIPMLPRLWDEPFGDSSQVPTYLLSQLTRQHVTVSLSGDGGDELFHGYNRYDTALNAWSKIAAIPGTLRAIAATTGIAVLAPLLRQKEPYSSLMLRRLQLIGTKDFRSFYREVISDKKNPTHLVLGSEEAHYVMLDDYDHLGLDRSQLMSLLDTLTYLPEDILTKVDRASMAVSLEARVPILDHRVVEFAATIPSTMNTRGGDRKRLLKAVLERHVPREMFERPKRGFGIPMAAWLRGELRDWAEMLLSPAPIMAEGYLDNDIVQQTWLNFLHGDDGRSAQVWNILMFQSWLREQA